MPLASWDIFVFVFLAFMDIHARICNLVIITIYIIIIIIIIICIISQTHLQK